MCINIYSEILQNHFHFKFCNFRHFVCRQFFRSTFCPFDILSVRHFVRSTFCLFDILSVRHFVCRHFVCSTFCLSTFYLSTFCHTTAAHTHAFEVPKCRTVQYSGSFIPWSVSFLNDLDDSVFDSGGLSGFKSRANSLLLASLS